MNSRLKEAFEKKKTQEAQKAQKAVRKRGRECWLPLAAQRQMIWWEELEVTPKKDAQAVSVVDAMAKLEEVRTALEKMTPAPNRLAAIEARLLALESRRPTAMLSVMKSLASSDIEVVKPIPVIIEADEDESFIATFMDAGISSGGETVQEAFESLQLMLATVFRMLMQESDSQLGPKMLRQKQVLLEFLCHSAKRTPKPSQIS